LNEAESDAVARINAAQTERNAMIAKIKGDASLFTNVLPFYRNDPDLFVQLQLAEVLGRTLASVDYKMYLPTTPDGKPMELRLNLNREPLKRRPGAPAPGG
jgi:hypothetical protein